MSKDGHALISKDDPAYKRAKAEMGPKFYSSKNADAKDLFGVGTAGTDVPLRQFLDQVSLEDNAAFVELVNAQYDSRVKREMKAAGAGYVSANKKQAVADDNERMVKGLATVRQIIKSSSSGGSSSSHNSDDNRRLMQTALRTVHYASTYCASNATHVNTTIGLDCRLASRLIHDAKVTRQQNDEEQLDALMAYLRQDRAGAKES